EVCDPRICLLARQQLQGAPCGRLGFVPSLQRHPDTAGTLLNVDDPKRPKVAAPTPGSPEVHERLLYPPCDVRREGQIDHHFDPEARVTAGLRLHQRLRPPPEGLRRSKAAQLILDAPQGVEAAHDT